MVSFFLLLINFVLTPILLNEKLEEKAPSGVILVQTTRSGISASTHYDRNRDGRWDLVVLKKKYIGYIRMPDPEFDRHFKELWRSGIYVELVDSDYDGYFELKTISFVDVQEKTKMTMRMFDEHQRGVYTIQERLEHRISKEYLFSSCVTGFWRNKMHALRDKLASATSYL